MSNIFNDIIDRLDSFIDYEENWDSYGAKKIDKAAVDKAKDLISSICVFPTKKGGVSIETNLPDAEIVIEISQKGKVISVHLVDNVE